MMFSKDEILSSKNPKSREENNILGKHISVIFKIYLADQVAKQVDR